MKLTFDYSLVIWTVINAFCEFHKAVYNQINWIITTYNISSKYLGDHIEEYYMRNQRLDYFHVINEAQILL